MKVTLVHFTANIISYFLLYVDSSRAGGDELVIESPSGRKLFHRRPSAIPTAFGLDTLALKHNKPYVHKGKFSTGSNEFYLRKWPELLTLNSKRRKRERRRLAHYKKHDGLEKKSVGSKMYQKLVHVAEIVRKKRSIESMRHKNFERYKKLLMERPMVSDETVTEPILGLADEDNIVDVHNVEKRSYWKPKNKIRLTTEIDPSIKFEEPLVIRV